MVTVSGNITRSNITSQSWRNLYNLINLKSNVADPIFTNSTRKMVYAREPDVSDINSEGYPFIILKPVSITTEAYTLDDASSRHRFVFIIEIRCTDRIRGREGNGEYSFGIQYVDELTDSIIKTLQNQNNRNLLNSYGTGSFDIETESMDSEDIDGDLVWVRRIRLTSKKVLRTGS